jgi:hypothetical protein
VGLLLAVQLQEENGSMHSIISKAFARIILMFLYSSVKGINKYRRYIRACLLQGSQSMKIIPHNMIQCNKIIKVQVYFKMQYTLKMTVFWDGGSKHL